MIISLNILRIIYEKFPQVLLKFIHKLIPPKFIIQIKNPVTIIVPKSQLATRKHSQSHFSTLFFAHLFINSPANLFVQKTFHSVIEKLRSFN